MDGCVFLALEQAVFSTRAWACESEVLYEWALGGVKWQARAKSKARVRRW